MIMKTQGFSKMRLNDLIHQTCEQQRNLNKNTSIVHINLIKINKY